MYGSEASSTGPCVEDLFPASGPIWGILQNEGKGLIEMSHGEYVLQLNLVLAYS